MKRRTALKSTFLSLLAVSTPVLAGREWNTSLTAPAIESADDAIQLYGDLNGIVPASQEALVSVFPNLQPLLGAPCLAVGHGEAAGERRATQAADAALANLLLARMDRASIHGIHIAIKSRQSQTRLGEIFAAVTSIRRHLPDETRIAYRSIDDAAMGDRLQVSILAASLRRS